MSLLLKFTQSISASLSWTYLFKEVVLILTFIYLFLVNGTAADFVNEPVLKITFGLLTAVGLAWLLAGQPAPTPLARPLLLFVGVYFLACLTSIDPRRSLEDFGWLVFIVFLFALSADLVAHHWPGELIIKSLIVAGGMILAFVWIDPITWYLRWLEAAPGEWIPSIVYRPPGANTLAMFLNTYLMITLARLVASRSRVNRMLFGGLILATLGMLYLTSSRAGWLGTAAGLSTLAVLLLRARRFDPKPVWGWLRAHPARLFVAGAGLLALLLPVGWLLYRQTLHPSHGPLLNSREQFWGPAITTFLEHPLLGQGPYTFSSSLLRARTLGSGQIFVHAHSTPLNLLAETGLLGLAAGLFLAYALVRAMHKRWKSVGAVQDRLNRDSAVVLGACAALAAYGVHGLADAFQAEPIGLWLLAVVLGAALGQPGIEASRPWHFRPWWVAALITAAWFNYWLMEPLFRGVEAGNSGQWVQASAQFELATLRDPDSAVAWQQLGLAESVLAEQGDATVLARARLAFENASALDPDWALNHANLGALYRASGDNGKARAAMQEAVRRAPDIGLYQLNLGVIAEEQGDGAVAAQAYLLALERMPWGREADFWSESDVRREAKQAWRASPPSQAARMTINNPAELPAIYPGETSSAYYSYSLVAFRKPACYFELVPQAAYLSVNP